jgi:hypothetical protein
MPYLARDLLFRGWIKAVRLALAMGEVVQRAGGFFFRALEKTSSPVQTDLLTWEKTM